MAVCKFCRAPSGLWCGVVEYNGGHIFSAGRTLDDLLKRIKNHTHTVTRGELRCAQIYLDTKQHDPYEFAKLYKVFMSTMFVSKYWSSKDPKKEVEPESYRRYYKSKDDTDTKPIEVKPIEVKPIVRKSKRDEHITEMDGNEIVVYKLVEVARYKLHSATSKTAEPIVNTDAEQPVLQNDFECQEENL